MNTITRLLFGGDVMLGRLVKDAILSHGSDYPMGHIAGLMNQADLTIVNLECAITTNNAIWSGSPKAFYFGAPPEAARILTNCGVKIVSLANNHVLDYDYLGLLDTFKFLQSENILFAGAGKNEDEAHSPIYTRINNQLFGMVAFCDHQQDFAATFNTPGMAYLDLDNEKSALNQFEKSLMQMKNAKVDIPIISLHWGPNMVHRPSPEFKRLAHAAIDMGYKILFGHSAHVFHGIEIYKKCPIIYAAGDLVDDYYVDDEFKNDHQLLIEIELKDNALQRIILHPVFIHNCQTVFPNENQFNFIKERAKILCQELGCHVQEEGKKLIIL